MLHIVLYQPEIPPNTGNIIRLCANTGMHLHLIRPLGFVLDDKRLRRAGLDYDEWARVQQHHDLPAFLQATRPPRVLAASTRGTTCYTECRFQAGDAIVFGPETRGLPQDFLASLPPGQVLRIPMQPQSRSMNLANSVAVMAYEAWRQLGFAGGT